MIWRDEVAQSVTNEIKIKSAKLVHWKVTKETVSGLENFDEK